MHGFTISFPFLKFILGDAIILSKTDPHNGSKKEKVKLKIIKPC